MRLALTKGKGRVHAKWSPVAACPLVPRVTLDVSAVRRVMELSAASRQDCANYLD